MLRDPGGIVVRSRTGRELAELPSTESPDVVLRSAGVGNSPYTHRHIDDMGMSSTVFRTSAIVLALITQASCASTQSVPAGQPLRVMTYNIQYGNEGLDSVIATIRAENPDIVGLQEVDVHWMERSRFVDQAALLAKSLGMEFRFAPIYRIPNADASKPPREFGVGLLSRYPIVSFRNHEIMRHSTQVANRSEEHTSELQSPCNLVCR